MLELIGTPALPRPHKFFNLLLRPQVQLSDFVESIATLKEKIAEIPSKIRELVMEQAEISTKYDGYIEKEFEMVEDYSPYNTMNS